MTKEQQTQLEKDALHAVYSLEQEAEALKLKLSLIGQPLEKLGRALQNNPEHVSPLPAPHFLYDYTQGLNLLHTRGNPTMSAKFSDLQASDHSPLDVVSD